MGRSRRSPGRQTEVRAATSDWRRYRPAIWMAMIGIAVLVIVNVYVGILLVGAGLGIGLRIESRRRRARRSQAGPRLR
jgi:hypothetical protein